MINILRNKKSVNKRSDIEKLSVIYHNVIIQFYLFLISLYNQIYYLNYSYNQ